MAGNITRSLTRDVLKKISSEFRKSTRLHNDVVMELMLTQSIMKELGTSTTLTKAGYIQHLQVDPFGVHLYTDASIRILVAHLKENPPVTLHLDATGGVVSKLPNQPKRVLYYALVFPGKGKDKPPLPVSELLSNEHSVPTLSFWLMETLRKVSRCTVHKIRQVETDYSWALINSVLLAFNKESVTTYLIRAHTIIRKQMGKKELDSFTVLHLCSAHILKAVCNGFGRRTNDKGLQQYATYCFAALINCTNMAEALDIFLYMCVVFKAKKESPYVTRAKKYLDRLIKSVKHTEVNIEQDIQREALEVEKKTCSKSLMGNSPFNAEFMAVLEQAHSKLQLEEDTSGENLYFCPGVIDSLFANYMGIFPLWSGILLGSLSRYSADSDLQQIPTKTRETNCHVEMWFWLVKHNILQKKKFLRPATFIHKMYGSLQGRYTEHIMKHNLPVHLLNDPLPIVSDVHQAEEQWAKREKNSNKPKRKSKYFQPPDQLPRAKPMPKKSKTKKRSSNSTAVQKQSSAEAGSATEERGQDSADEEKNTDRQESQTWVRQPVGLDADSINPKETLAEVLHHIYILTIFFHV